MRPGLLATALTIGAVACSDSVAPRPALPEPSTFVALVSDPAPSRSSSNAPAREILLSAHDGGATVAYVSLHPGTVPRGNTLSIKNLRTAQVVMSRLVDGGADPVAIGATAGDTLELIATDSGGVGLRLLLPVPARRPPKVVRTRPPNGGRGVPLNLNIGAVFSEPIQAASATTETVILTAGGERVPGSVTTSADGLSVDYVPSEPLVANGDYTLCVTRGVRDLAGDPLDEEVEARFTTGSEQTASAMIAFARGDRGNIFTPDLVADIWTMRPDGSQERNLTSHPADDHSPDWSPDGSKIAFTSDRDGKRAIFVMNADGTDPRRLIAGEFEDFSPAWSPDGASIAFARKTGTTEAQIYVAHADGSGATAITSGAGLRYGPSWSPDSKQIAYTHHTYLDARYQNPNIHIAAANGSGSREVTSFVEFNTTCPFARDPSWSPDGATILVYGCPLGVTTDLGVHKLAPDGSDLVRVQSSGEVGWDARWADGGRRIVFVKDRRIHMMSPTGRDVVQLTFGAHADQQPAWRP